MQEKPSVKRIHIKETGDEIVQPDAGVARVLITGIIPTGDLEGLLGQPHGDMITVTNPVDGDIAPIWFARLSMLAAVQFASAEVLALRPDSTFDGVTVRELMSILAEQAVELMESKLTPTPGEQVH